MKTKEELNALKAEVEALDKKLSALTEDELAQVAGGLRWEDETVIKSPKLISPLLRMNGEERFLERGSKNYPKDILD